MKSFVHLVGAVFVTLFMYAIPIVLTLSFACDWDDAVKFVMVTCAMGQLGVLFMFIWEEALKDDDDV